jgi:hypothetical protein
MHFGLAPLRLSKPSDLRTRAAAVIIKHNIGECASRTDNDEYKYRYDECRHAGNLRRPSMVIELRQAVDRVDLL